MGDKSGRPGQGRSAFPTTVAASERLDPDHLAEQVERLAQHAFRGQVWDKAVAYCCQAGNKAAARSANREAVASFEQALVALTHLPEGRDTCEQAIDLRFDLRNALAQLGEIGRALDFLRETETLAQRLDDQGRLGRVYARMINCFWLVDDLGNALASGQRALAIAAALGDFPL